MSVSKFESLWRDVEDEISNIRLKRDKFFIDCCPETLLNTKGQNINEFLLSEIKRLTIDLQNRFDPISKDVSKTDTAYYYYLLGKINNLSPEYNLICEDYLTKAIKLDPNSFASLFWNEMCECLWKKRDVNGAKNCLDTVLKKTRDKVTLRNLSLVLRQLEQCQNSDGLELATKSVQLAKEAVDMDPNDGTSLYISANASFVYFFKSDQWYEKFLNKALELYEKALDDERIKFSPDLHYNKAMAHTYMEQYEQALVSLKRCLQLEPSFKKAAEDLHLLEIYLKRVYDNFVRKGKLKNNKIKQLSESLKSTNTVGGQSEYKIIHSVENELRFGSNPGTMCKGKVVSIIFNERIIPYTFCIIDQNEFCSLVTVYNFNREKFGLIIGQMVEILEPDFDLIKFTLDDQVYKYPRIRLQNPTKLIINGKRCKANDHVPSTTRFEMI